ncbi:MAG: lysylphosphatidylglycerol synthase transmembrane domain-containing protein [Anaerolineaceae bacterium]
MSTGRGMPATAPPPGHLREHKRPGRLRRFLTNRWLIQLLVVGLLLSVAAWRIDIGELGRAFSEAQYTWLFFALVVYTGSRVVHAWEWQITLTKVGRAPFFGLFGATLIGTLVNAVVPAAAGDVVKIQIVANRYKLPRAGLIAGRGAEAVVNALIMVVFIVISFTLPAAGFASTTVLWFLAGGTLVAFAGAVFVSHRIPEAAPGWRLLGRLPRRMRGGIESHWPRFREGLEVMRRPKLLAIEVALNLFGWLVDILIFWAFGRAFHLHLPLAAYVSVTVVVAIITVFPITFGNVGTYELALLSAFSLYDIPAHDALAYAVGSHLFSTAFNVGLGLVAMWSMGMQPGDVFRLRAEAPENPPPM